MARSRDILALSGLNSAGLPPFTGFPERALKSSLHNAPQLSDPCYADLIYDYRAFTLHRFIQLSYTPKGRCGSGLAV